MGYDCVYGEMRVTRSGRNVDKKVAEKLLSRGASSVLVGGTVTAANDGTRT